MITLKNISKIYRQNHKTITALDNISLTVEQGEIYGVVGESGAGKSTLIRCVNLLELPSHGEVIIDGKSLTQLSKTELLAERHQIGMIFQHFNLLSSRTVAENIALPLELINASKANIREKVASLLALTGLTDKANFYPAQLSGGQKQRVAIARALAGDSKILLSDEATSALDPKTTDAILTLLKDINRKLGVTILLITHEMDVVKKICDKVALLDSGKLVESASVEAFFSAPQSALGKKFVDQVQRINLPEAYQQKLKPSGAHPVIQIHFQGDIVTAPIISQLSRDFALDVNIVQANLEQLRSMSIGVVVAELLGTAENIANALTWLNTQPIKVEIMGYV